MTWLRDLVFDTPWWVLLAIGVAAVVLLVSGNSRQNKQLKLTGMVVLLLGIALGVVSWLVDTPREIAVRQTNQIAQAVVARDRNTIMSLLHPRLAAGALGRDDIADAAIYYADHFGLRSVTLTGMEVQEQPGMVTTTFAAFSRHDTNSSMPVDTLKTSWQFDWLETDDHHWLLKNIVPLGGSNMDQETMRKRYFSSRPG